MQKSIENICQCILKKWSIRRLSGLIMLSFLCIFIVLSNLQTISIYDKYFTHYDDIGVAAWLYPDDIEIQNRRAQKCKNGLNSVANKIESEKVSYIANNVCKYVSDYWRTVMIPLGWTYAPMQFIFTQHLVNENKINSYQEVKTAGRFPSIAFLFVGFISLFFLVRTYIPKLRTTFFFPLFSIAIVTLSLEQKIYASQMENYAVGVLSNVLILYALISLNTYFKEINNKSLIYYSLVISLGISMTYQGIFLFIAGMFALFLNYFMANNINIAFFKRMLIFLSLSIFFGLITYLTFFLDVLLNRHHGGPQAGLGWNRGLEGEFHVEPSLTFIQKIYEFIELLFNETLYVIYSVTSGVEVASFWMISIIGLIYFVLIVSGFHFIFKRSSSNFFSYISLLIIVYISLILLLVFQGMLTFSPTRHIIYYLVPISLVMSYGLLNLFKRKAAKKMFYIVFSSYLFFSLSGFSSFAAPRLDVINPDEMVSKFKNSSANLLLYDVWDLEPILIDGLSPSSLRIGGEIPKCDQLLDLGLRRSYKFVWYSKKRKFEEAKIDIKTFLDERFKSCFQELNKDKQYLFSNFQDLILITSSTEIDLSNRTKNGANQLFFQYFEYASQD